MRDNACATNVSDGVARRPKPLVSQMLQHVFNVPDIELQYFYLLVFTLVLVASLFPMSHFSIWGESIFLSPYIGSIEHVLIFTWAYSYESALGC